jgi:hypothetical protein
MALWLDPEDENDESDFEEGNGAEESENEIYE